MIGVRTPAERRFREVAVRSAFKQGLISHTRYREILASLHDEEKAEKERDRLIAEVIKSRLLRMSRSVEVQRKSRSG